MHLVGLKAYLVSKKIYCRWITLNFDIKQANLQFFLTSKQIKFQFSALFPLAYFVTDSEINDFSLVLKQMAKQEGLPDQFLSFSTFFLIKSQNWQKETETSIGFKGDQ